MRRDTGLRRTHEAERWIRDKTTEREQDPKSLASVEHSQGSWLQLRWHCTP